MDGTDCKMQCRQHYQPVTCLVINVGIAYDNVGFVVIEKKLDRPNSKRVDSKNCSVCRDFLTHMKQFFNMLETARKPPASDWLTVGDIAKELKISKSIVYRLIHHGELEASDLVETNGEIAKKGHYRIRRSSLNQYLESKKVRPFPNQSAHRTRSRRFPKVKNHLGL